MSPHEGIRENYNEQVKLDTVCKKLSRSVFDIFFLCCRVISKDHSFKQLCIWNGVRDFSGSIMEDFSSCFEKLSSDAFEVMILGHFVV